MRKTLQFILLIIMSVSGLSLAQTGQNLITSKAAGKAHASPYNVYGVEYPRIEADSRVTFRFNAAVREALRVLRVLQMHCNKPGLRVCPTFLR